MEHGYHGTTTNIKALRISAILIFVYFIFEIIVAFITHSLALLADAAHELSTVVAIGISLIAIELGARKPTPERTFGFLRLEVVAAFVNGLLLLGMAGFILTRGFNRVMHPIEIPSTPMFIVGIGGIGLEIAALYIMYRGQKENLNIRGAFWHVVNAFMGSIAVILAATFIFFGRVFVADAWAGIIFAFVLIWASYGLIRDSFNILIDTTPKNIYLVDIERDLKNINGVIETHHLHARAVAENIKTFSGHLIVKDLKDSERILREAKEILDIKYKFSLSTIQLENEELAESDTKELEYGERDHVDH
ncbi:TPA: hypothetical protein DDW69_02035 [candidate division CPR2 bacterium]|uniref:Cation diffusion facilitator family transporter n=1 Tax=candidate division CPR2 bacterium GW2011_GWC1_41_48 TaxID=1618344 RepID=A0A0G0Z9T8_UNCC2|nr:MAG: Cation diffusion facilitator family transporter [candidate division CPR2 bacterium GW2011_GWC2_39_35]KKR28139.1 MAG: Cation diffusion facilitator family transporter [candidate division CPR2 bacterium GW2011_GWD2_39_7]KKS09803.1 MAG: Cation diffusion facilitator family transporter [candidate division CPR2 bacterium GW2011_GWC1_41_48]HBG81599.1 hypothetical protein [candidate division CPR2 bacterium]HCL99436.1 hypothetical protein [candidate division CPR2 bacterium]